jgi:hypothetical protein
VSVFSGLFLTCLACIYTSQIVVTASKANHGASVSKGVKKNHVTLRLTKKLEVLKMNIIVQTLKSLLYCIIFWTVHLNCVLFFTLGIPET